MQKLDDTQDTPPSWLSPIPLLGLDTIDHVDASDWTGPKKTAPAAKPSPAATPTTRIRNCCMSSPLRTLTNSSGTATASSGSALACAAFERLAIGVFACRSRPLSLPLIPFSAKRAPATASPFGWNAALSEDARMSCEFAPSHGRQEWFKIAVCQTTEQPDLTELRQHLVGTIHSEKSRLMFSFPPAPGLCRVSRR